MTLDENSNEVINRDAELFDRFLATLDQHERDYYTRLVRAVSDNIRNFGEKSAKHLLVRMVYYYDQQVNPRAWRGWLCHE